MARKAADMTRMTLFMKADVSEEPISAAPSSTVASMRAAPAAGRR